MKILQQSRTLASKSLLESQSKVKHFPKSLLESQSHILLERRRTPWLHVLRAARPREPYFDCKFNTTRQVIQKQPKDSWTSARLPFRDDEWFLDAYVDARGGLRIGNLLQDLDAIAGIIAYKHCQPAEPVIVTAGLQGVWALHQIPDPSIHNVLLAGEVVQTGRSSMTVVVRATSDETEFLIASFKLVARDPNTKLAFPVNCIRPEDSQVKLAANTQVEKEMVEQQDSQLRKEAQVKVEAETTNASREASANQTEPVTLFSSSIMQPQDRNRHGYIVFGGYLLRITYEHALTCAASFARALPKFVSLDSATFKKPVHVGSILSMRARVVYTRHMTPHGTLDRGSLIHVLVETAVRDVHACIDSEAGSFSYSFYVHAPVHDLIARNDTERDQFVAGRHLVQQTTALLRENFNQGPSAV